MTGRRSSPLAGGRVALACCLAFLVWANVKTPMWADDYCRVIDPTTTDAIALAWRDYLDWTGRFFVGAITYWAMGAGWRWSMLPFDLLNALISLGLIVVVVRLARLAGGGDPAAPRDGLAGFADVMFAALLLWWGPRAVGEVALWKTGSVGYLWAVCGELLILERVMALVLLGSPPPRLPLAVPFAFVAATFLEPLSVLLSAVLWLQTWRARRAKQPARWLLAVASSHAAGTLFLLAAPGNLARARALAVVAPGPPGERFAGVTAALGKMADGYTLGALALAALALAPGPGQAAAGLAWRARIAQAAGAGRGWTFLVLALAYALTLLAVPPRLLESRVTFPASVFLICYAVSLFLLRPVAPARNAALAVTLSALAGLTTIVVAPDLRRIAAVDAAWSAALSEARPGSDVVLPMIRGRHGTITVNKHRFFEGFTNDAGYFVNRCYARAWGMASVTGR